jgi:hypothetical protein
MASPLDRIPSCALNLAGALTAAHFYFAFQHTERKKRLCHHNSVLDWSRTYPAPEHGPSAKAKKFEVVFSS